MSSGKRRKEYVLLESIRSGRPMSWRQRLELIVRLSVPSMLAQLSSIVMLYIDASMVGSLGAEASASIGLIYDHLAFQRGVRGGGHRLYRSGGASDRCR